MWWTWKHFNKVILTIRTFVMFSHWANANHVTCSKSTIKTTETYMLNFVWNAFMLTPSRLLLVQSQQWKHDSNLWNMFKVNNKSTRTTSVTSVSLLLISNRFHTLVWCFPWWNLSSKCQQDNSVYLNIWMNKFYGKGVPS